jgi:hypothetical protein
MSGVSSADVGPTGGQYGSVWLRRQTLEISDRRTLFGRYIPSRAWPPCWQQFTTLSALTLRPQSTARWIIIFRCLFDFRSLTIYEPKAWVVFNFVSMSSHDVPSLQMRERVSLSLVCFSLELRLLGSCLFFAFGGIPHVSQLGSGLRSCPRETHGNGQHRDLEQG